MKTLKLVSRTLLILVFFLPTIIPNTHPAISLENTTGSNRPAADEVLLLQLYIDKIVDAEICPALRKDSGAVLWENCTYYAWNAL